MMVCSDTDDDDGVGDGHLPAGELCLLHRPHPDRAPRLQCCGRGETCSLLLPFNYLLH